LPLNPDTSPRRLRIAHLSFDALFDTGEFVHVVDQLSRYGADIRQFNKCPRPGLRFDDPRPAVRVARYRAFGLRVGINLPHRNEVANIVTLDEASLDEVLNHSLCLLVRTLWTISEEGNAASSRTIP
jgi:hypothetical protein